MAGAMIMAKILIDPAKMSVLGCLRRTVAAFNYLIQNINASLTGNHRP